MTYKNITFYTQNSIRVATPAGNVYFDTFRMEDAPHDAAVVFVTHEHYDHFSPEDIAKVCCSDTVLVVPEAMSEKAREASGLVKEIVTVCPNGKYEVCGLTFETVPSYNLPPKTFHPQSAQWVGYILTVDGERIYVAGDSDATDEARAVKCDIALLPIGGKYTMNAEEAAALVNAMDFKYVIPTHFFDPGAKDVFRAGVKGEKTVL